MGMAWHGEEGGERLARGVDNAVVIQKKKLIRKKKEKIKKKKNGVADKKIVLELKKTKIGLSISRGQRLKGTDRMFTVEKV